jgi:hypothetical protein
MGPEEGARFYAQVQAEQRKILEISRQALVLQAIPINHLDPAPKQQYQKGKIHGKADARGQNGAEIAKKGAEGGVKLRLQLAEKGLQSRLMTLARM